MSDSLVFKRADSPAEFDQIHRLNYRTFAEEVGQHAADGSGVLVDRFHSKNTYFIALEQGRLLGMIAVHDEPPFSVSSRLPDPSILASLSGPLLEVRLLAIAPEARRRMILAGILWELYRYAKARGYSHLIISGLAERAPMYEKLGFRPLGPAVPDGAASFIPMALSLIEEPAWLMRNAGLYFARQQRKNNRPLISLLPGPVEIALPVREAFARRPLSHRSAEFIEAYERTRARLSALACGMETAILVGSGTTANDAVAAHLRAVCRDAPGLVLANGEFGDRLIQQARRAGLRFEALRWSWGRAWDFAHIERAARGAAWIWGVHLETSTGVLNDIGRLMQIAAAAQARVAVDCVSSIGAVPLDLHGAFLATGVSGKALGAYAGLSFVFAAPGSLDDKQLHKLPACFDIRCAIRQRGSLFTAPSPQLFALDSALELNYADRDAAAARFAEYRRLGAWVRARMRECGISPLACEADAAPSITTFEIPFEGFIEKCRRAGFEIASESSYLRERGWAQIAIMGAIGRAELEPLFGAIQAGMVIAATA
jgi:aspartate aminotransferase-like enzyme/GNAT superfamily N-acetyltransferase